MANTNVPVAGSNIAPVTDTLAQILNALTLGASVTFTFPPGTTNTGGTTATGPTATGGQATATGPATTGSQATTTGPATTGSQAPSTTAAAAPVPSAPSAPVPAVAPIANIAPVVPTGSAAPAAGATNTTTTTTANTVNVAPAPNAVVPTVVVMNPDAIIAGAIGGDVPDVIDEKYYVVTVGRRIGVFLSWNRTSPYVVGASGCTYSCVGYGIGTRDKAFRAFNEAFEAGECHVVP